MTMKCQQCGQDLPDTKADQVTNTMVDEFERTIQRSCNPEERMVFDFLRTKANSLSYAQQGILMGLVAGTIVEF